MYNSKQKIEFLNTITNDNSYKSFQRVFRAVESMEERFEKDVCQMNVDEILTIMDLKTGTRMTNTEQFMSLLRAYVDWCIQNGRTTSENNFEKIDASETDKSRIYKSKYIKNPEELENMISTVFCIDYNYKEDIDKPKELCIRLCYEGLEDEEIVLLKKSDVDYENKVIRSPLYSDIIYKVSDKILELCDFCTHQEDVEYLGKSGMRKERLCDNDFLLRQRIGTLRGNPEDRPINKTLIVRRVKEFNDSFVEATGNYKSITASKLRESHLFYRAYTSDNPGVFIENEIRYEIEVKNPDINDRQMRERLRQIKNTFKCWKDAFY